MDAMVDVSRIGLGQLTVQLEPVDFRSILNESVKTAEPAAGQRGVRIETDLESATVNGDRVRLRQVFGNLLSNAVKFSPPNGRIQLVVHHNEERVEIAVIDEGKGISAKFLPRLFERFSQEEQGSFGGLGLGLFIARHLVERHGGTIDATSEGEGKGATFRVTLPLGG